MNKQLKKKRGVIVGRGIEWTDFTWNPVSGCKHQCRWKMPSGDIAICYAENVALNLAQAAYPSGFEHHYYHQERLNEPFVVKEPAKIFLDSMSDLMGNWVSDDEIKSVLDQCAKSDWHIFQLLTKNAPRLLKFEFPKNVWVGASTPPDFMFGKELSQEQKNKMLERTIEVFAEIKIPIRWMSVEPLSWDVADIFKTKSVLEWVVIGAATDRNKAYQPASEHVSKLFAVFDSQRVPIFMKGNLKWTPFREEFPQEFPL